MNASVTASIRILLAEIDELRADVRDLEASERGLRAMVDGTGCRWCGAVLVAVCDDSAGVDLHDELQLDQHVQRRCVRPSTAPECSR